jgi:ABC-type transport system substrate-binding protein
LPRKTLSWWGADREPVSLDPSALTVSYARLIEHQIYDTLLKMDENLNIVGELAESWRQLDDLTWEFKLRKGVKFHNGDRADLKGRFVHVQEAVRPASREHSR